MKTRHRSMSSVRCSSLVGVTAFVFGIIEGPERGWTDPLTFGAIGLGIGMGVAFVLWELRTEASAARPAPLPEPWLQCRHA